jgi:hypothetical protein
MAGSYRPDTLGSIKKEVAEHIKTFFIKRYSPGLCSLIKFHLYMYKPRRFGSELYLLIFRSMYVGTRVTCANQHPRVEAGSNTSTVTLRVVGGDEKGSLKGETVKYGRETQGARTKERLRWQGPAAYIKVRPVHSSERAPHQKKKTP